MVGIFSTILLDKRFQRKDGSYPVKLRITFNRQQKYYSVGKHLSEVEWEQVKENDPKDKELNRIMYPGCSPTGMAFTGIMRTLVLVIGLHTVTLPGKKYGYGL